MEISINKIVFESCSGNTLFGTTCFGLAMIGCGSGPFAGKYADILCGGGEALILTGILGLGVETGVRVEEEIFTQILLRVENMDIDW